MMADGEIYDASLRGRLKKSSVGRVLVGDRVKVKFHEGATATIEEVQPRSSVLRRRQPGKTRGVREVAANIGRVMVVGAAADPEWNQQLINRFIVVAEASEIPVTVVLNKIDLHSVPNELVDVFRKVGYAVLLTSVEDGSGIDELKESLTGRVSLLTGQTGVGKSSLLNAIQPGLKLRTAPVSERSRRGRHTTVAAEMHPLAAGGFVVDTPGLRDIGLWGVEREGVVRAFPEVARASVGCRFDDCRHMEEPDCAVVAACEDGDIDDERLLSYRTLLGEAEAAGRHW